MRMYQTAARAFGAGGRLDDFQVVYDGLRKWKLFRAGRVEAPETVFEWLNAGEGDLRQRRLSTLGLGDWGPIWDAIYRMRNVKPNITGPSLMAISKFLHFWNRCAFVICDQEEVERFVFGHQWLRNELQGVNVADLTDGAAVVAHFRLAQYLKVLVFASEFVRANQHILARFAEMVRGIIGGADVLADIETYEATAVEWCLIEATEMMPLGVEVI